jgi:hypothetical protein
MFKGSTIVASNEVIKGQCFATRFEQFVWKGPIDNLISCPTQADTLHAYLSP